jgi:cobaltochelatase CobS
MTAAAMLEAETKPTASDKIICKIDGQPCHSIERHIKEFHADWSVERYKQEFPGEPLLSVFAIHMLSEIRKKKEAEKKLTENLNTGMARPRHGATAVKKPFHELFDLGNIPAAMSDATQQPIPVTAFENLDSTDQALVPDVDDNYVYNVELLKMVMIAFELNMPMYAWGYHGTGKTTLFEQAAARTGRPFMRIQHTANTEEAEVIGQWVVDAKDGVSVTEFQLGPLPTAMINGYVLCADEYDVANPGIVALYQPVLEGKSLYIKNAPPALRMIRPHPNFRFVATGNTNGGGDETGLYQGTQIQNAANYSRFKITEEVTYMEEKLEIAVVQGQARIEKKHSERLVKFANMVREQFKNGKIGMTVSPRELISAGLLGRVRGGNFRKGLESAFINRLSRVDKEAVGQLAQRIFG